MPIKTAGDPKQFENAFYSLAYAQLQDELGVLLPYLLGFEIVKTNSKDKTRALGVFCFKINDEILFAPVFFRNGNIRSMQLLYSVNNDQMWPMNEDIASLFTKRDVVRIGEASDKKQQEVRRNSGPDDLSNFIVPPRTGKTSVASEKCVEDNWRNFATNLLSKVAEEQEPAEYPDLCDFVKRSSNQTKEAFLGALQSNSQFLEAAIRFHGQKKIAECLIPHTTPKAEIKLQLLDKSAAVGLDESSKEKLFTDGYFILDKRADEEVSKFSNKQYYTAYRNPQENGIYFYVTKFGGLAPCMIFKGMHEFQSDFALRDTLVYNIDNKYAYIQESKRVFVRPLHVSDYSSFYKELSSPKNIKPGSDDYILVNESLSSTQPFRVISNFKDADNIRKMTVEVYTAYDIESLNGAQQSWRRDRSWQPKDGLGSVAETPRDGSLFVQKKKRQFTLVFTKSTGAQVHFKNGSVYVPKNFKFLPVKLRDSRVEGEKTEYEKGLPGNLASVQEALEKNWIYPISINKNQSEYYVNFNKAKNVKYASKVDALKGLVFNLGFTEKRAADILSQVDKQIRLEGSIKLAAIGDYTPQLTDPSSWTNVFGSPVTTSNPRAQTVNSHDQEDPHNAGYHPGDFFVNHQSGAELNPELINNAIQLAQTGQKELFDTQAISALARFGSPEKKIKEEIPKIMATVDALGRIIFLFNWDPKGFEELFNRDDLPEFDELISDTFSNLGELIVFLKKHNKELDINDNGYNDDV